MDSRHSDRSTGSSTGRPAKFDNTVGRDVSTTALQGGASQAALPRPQAPNLSSSTSINLIRSSRSSRTTASNLQQLSDTEQSTNHSVLRGVSATASVMPATTHPSGGGINSNPDGGVAFVGARSSGRKPTTKIESPRLMKALGDTTGPSTMETEPKDILLPLLRADLEALRTKVTCNICIRLLYVPYTLACGHTFCYSCLCQWFQGNKRKKTCPECRYHVTQLPAPAYLIRDLVELVINRTELIPAGETAEEHKKLREEESQYVETDRANNDEQTGGLFRGTFQPITFLRALMDEEDGVQRCPLCNWELESGTCGRCAVVFDEDGNLLADANLDYFSEFDESDLGDPDEDLDAELELEDHEVGMNSPERFAFRAGNFRGSRGHRRLSAASDALMDWYGSQAAGHPTTAHSNRAQRQSASLNSGTESWGDYSDDGMSDFVGDFETDEPDNDSSQGSSEEESEFHERNSHGVRASEAATARRRNAPLTSESVIEVDNDDSDEGGAITNGRRRRPGAQTQPTRPLRRRRRVVSSTTTETDGEEQYLPEDTQGLLDSGWSPLDHGHHGDEDEDMQSEDNDDEDDTKTTIPAESVSATRSRLGGSLTPTAERPTNRMPSARDRTRSQAVSASYDTYDTFSDDSTGALSRSRQFNNRPPERTPHFDGDGDIDMVSRENLVQLNRAMNATLMGYQTDRSQFGPYGASTGDAVDGDNDSTSDISIQLPRRRARVHRQPDPRISEMLARHQSEMRGNDLEHLPLDSHTFDAMMRAGTPTNNMTRQRNPNRMRHGRNIDGSDNRPAGAAQTAGRVVSGGRVPADMRSMSPPSNARDFHARTRASDRTNRAPEPFPSGTQSSSSRPQNLRLRSTDHVGSAWGSQQQRASRSSPIASVTRLATPTGVARISDLLNPENCPSPPGPSGWNSAQSHGQFRSLPQSAGVSSPNDMNAGRSLQRNPYADHFNFARSSQPRLRDVPTDLTPTHRSTGRLLVEPASPSPAPNTPHRNVSGPRNVRSQTPRSILRSTPSQQRLRSQNSAHGLSSPTAPGLSMPNSFSETGENATGTRLAPSPRTATRLVEEEERRHHATGRMRRPQEQSNEPRSTNTSQESAQSRSLGQRQSTAAIPTGRTNVTLPAAVVPTLDLHRRAREQRQVESSHTVAGAT